MLELGIIIALGVAILTGISSLYTKKSLVSLHAAQFMAGKSIMDLAMVLILAPFIAAWPGWKAIVVMLILTLIGGIASVLVTKSIRHQRMSEVFPLFNFSPLILIVMAFFFLGERITPLEYVGVGAIILGAYFLQADKHDLLKPFKRIKNKYVIFMLIAMVMYSILATAEKSFLGEPGQVISSIAISPLVYLWWIKLLLSIFYFVYDTFLYNPKEIKGVVKKNWRDLGIISGIGWVGLGLWYYAMTLVPVSVLIPIKRSSTLFATILGGKLFHEGHYVQRTIACAVMLAGVILMVL